jgi:transcriptional regulator with AAA-type ATPase domain
LSALVEDTHDDSAAPQRHPAGVVTPCLVVALECDRPTAGSARYSLDGVERVKIGRGEERRVTRSLGDATLDLRLPGRSMSASHARLFRMGYSWAVEDLGSRNGVFVDGQRVTQAVLEPDSTLEVGHTFLRVRMVLLPYGGPTDVEVPDDDDVLGTVDAPLQAGLERLFRLFGPRMPALLVGESGTGKEILARQLHHRSGRKGDFVAVNCGAIPGSLVESHLFGHVRGSFSGAVRDEIGFVRAAQGGTLFLDEVADLPRTSQAAFLRVLQEREVVPVGGTRPVPVDVQVIAATHQPLEQLVERGDFRRDLFARLAGSLLEVPALRDRRDDLGVLIATLLKKIAPVASASMSLSTEVGRALLTHDWPMNIRELERCVETWVSLVTDDGAVDSAHLPPSLAAVLRSPPTPSSGTRSALSERDERLRLELLAHLSRHQGNVTDVARAMGKARAQIHRWCRRFGMEPDAFRN